SHRPACCPRHRRLHEPDRKSRHRRISARPARKLLRTLDIRANEAIVRRERSGMVASVSEFSGEHIGAHQRDAGAEPAERGRTGGCIPDQGNAAIPPARQLNLPHLIEREIRCRARGLEQPRNMPSDTTEPIFQECDLGGAVASGVADPLSGAGTKAQRCFGLTWLAPGPDRGDESAGVVVQLIPVVEFFERRSGEPCRVQPERMDEVLLPPKSGRPNCRMYAVGADDEIETLWACATERDIHVVRTLRELGDGVVEDPLDTVTELLVEQVDEIAAEDLDLRDESFSAERIRRHGGACLAVCVDPGHARLLEADRTRPIEQPHTVDDCASGAAQVDGLTAGPWAGSDLDDRDGESVPSKPVGACQSCDACARDEYSSFIHIHDAKPKEGLRW